MLCLWRRPVATAPIGPLAWEPPYAAGAAQEIATTTTKDQKKKKKKIFKMRKNLLYLQSFKAYAELFICLCGFRFLSDIIIIGLIISFNISYSADLLAMNSLVLSKKALCFLSF